MAGETGQEMAEHSGGDAEERAWATRVARAFLADQGAGDRRQATAEGAARTRGVLVVAVVPLPVPGRGTKSRRRDRGMAEQQTERPCWRVVTHARNAGGWWTVAPERYTVRGQAEQAAARACTAAGGCSNAGVYAEVGGRVQAPGWIKVREGAGA